MISLRPVAWPDAQILAHLVLAPGQEDFVSPAAEMIAQPEDQVDLYGIVAGPAIVGMFKLDRGYGRLPRHDFAGPGDLGLRGLLIDAREQGKGYGRAVMAALPPLVWRDYPAFQRLCLTVNCRNTAAIGLYRQAGFTLSDQLYLQGRSGPQHILWLARP